MQILKLGSSYTYFFYFILTLTLFYLSNWEEHHTGVMRTCYRGIFGITEALLSLIFTMCLQGFFKGKLVQITLGSITNADEGMVSNKVIDLIGMLGVKGEASNANI